MAWVDAQLEARGAQALFDELVLRAPTTFCHPDGNEETRDLLFVSVQRLDMDGDDVVRSHEWLEKGSRPRMDPKAASWLVGPTTSEPPLRFVFTGRR